MRSAVERSKLGVLGIAAAILLLGHGPLFIRSPLGPDPVMYDLQAHVVDDGGVLYRDILEPNLPGATWFHLAVRKLAGWSGEALLAADLLVFCGIAFLAARVATTRFRTAEADKDTTVVIGGVLFLLLVGGYSTLSEWCHCQRDTWMLAPCLGAALLRIRRTARAAVGTEGGGRVFRSALLEGAAWGAAVWLKPHTVLIAAGAWMASAAWLVTQTSLASSDKRRVLGVDLIGALTGGLVVGACGIGWLMTTGAWPYLVSTLTEWNPEYLRSSAGRWTWERLFGMQVRLMPWSLIHLAALPLALLTLARLLAQACQRSSSSRPIHLSQAVVSVIYLVWVLQALFLQHLFDYVYAPTMVMAAIVVAGASYGRFRSVMWRLSSVGLAAGACLAVTFAPRVDQLRFWPACFGRSTDVELRANLARLPVPDWTALAQVRDYLAEQQVADGELTAYHTHTIHLYPWLNVTPSTRFVFTETHLRVFPDHAGEIERALATSSERFIVSSLLEAGLSAEAIDECRSLDDWRRVVPPDAVLSFPFNQPVVFRAGPYLVHRAEGNPGPVETLFFPLAAKSAGL